MISPFPWQESQALLMSRFKENDAVPQAMLFLGEDINAISVFIRAFIMDMLSVRLEDASLKSVSPDLFWWNLLDEKMAIDEVRALQSQLVNTTTSANQYRIIVIEAAMALSPYCANALLKILEEPPKQTVFVLSAKNAGQLLPTIVSRCFKVHFTPPNQTQLNQYFAEYDIDAELQKALSATPTLAKIWQATQMDAIYIKVMQTWKRYKTLTLNEWLETKRYFKSADLIFFLLCFDIFIRYQLSQHLNEQATMPYYQNRAVCALFRAYDCATYYRQLLEENTNLNKDLIMDNCLMALGEVYEQ